MCRCGALCLCDSPINAELVAQSLGTPVNTSRLWTTGLVPRVSKPDEWLLIQCYSNDPQPQPAEWNVLNLTTGAQTLDQDNPDPGKRGKPGSGQYPRKHQLRAPNGRIFWPAASVYHWVFDPTTERVTSMGRMPSGNGVVVTDAAGYSAQFNETGSMLYGGTTAAGGTDLRPMVYKINPVTLAQTPICRVGGNAHTQPGWAYFLWAVGDFLYVLVGQDFWEIVAVDLRTNTQAVLLTETDHAQMFFVQKPEGLCAQVYTNRFQANQTLREFLLEDGKLFPYTPGVQPFPWRDVTPYTNPVANPPQIDETQAPNAIGTRPAGSTGAWTWHDISINYATPIPIDSLTALPDDTVLGDVDQYQGFWRFDLMSGLTTRFGAWNGVTEGNARAVVNGKVYLSGYPNGVLWEYDPTLPWSATNPKKLGSYSDGVNLSGVKRANALAYHATSNRLFMAGLRDRTGFGAGVGYYDFALKKFFGHYAGLEAYTGHLGLAVVGDYVVIGGNVPELVVHDTSLNELARHTIDLEDYELELTETGRLFSAGACVLGISVADSCAYLAAVDGTPVGAVDLAAFGPIGAMSEDLYGNITLIAGPDPVHGDTSILQLSKSTLDITLIGRATTQGISRIAQANCDLYVASGTELLVYAGILPV